MNEFEVCAVTPSLIRCRLPTESNCGPAGSVHRLGSVHSLDVVLELRVKEDGRCGKTRLTLKQVPKFLINAFNFIIKHGLGLEGLFRREGNASRLNQNNWAVYMGEAPLPDSLTVHDVCSMVKRFFRDLKEPLLPNAVLRKALLELAKKNELKPIELHDFCSLFEPAYESGRKSLDHCLPDAHIGTLGYLMRQLLGISRHANKHQMDVSNLATVFAPTLFREDKLRRKDRRGSQEDLLTTLRGDTKLQIAAVRLLIERANWIGLHRDFYVTSNHPHRSSSAVATPRQSFLAAVVNEKELTQYPERKLTSKGNDQSVPPLPLDRKASIKANEKSKSKSSSSRRSSSAYRLFSMLKGRSPSRERNKSERRASSPAVVFPSGQNELCPNGLLGQRLRPRYLLEFTESPPQINFSEYTHVNGISLRGPLRPSSTRLSRSRQPVVVTSAKPIVPASNAQNRTSKVSGSHSIGRSSYGKYEAPIYKRDSRKKQQGGSPPLRTNKVLKDNPISMLGEEHFNPSYREQHERSRRRHTTPVKTSTALRRNQPNTRHSGLHEPKRRATVVNAHEQEKENRHRSGSGSVSVSNSRENLEDAEREDSLAVVDFSTDLLTQRGQESRLRRVKRQQRRELSAILQDSIFDNSTLDESVDKKERAVDRVMRVSVGCSPIVFPTSPSDSKNICGSAIVGETIVVTPMSVPSPAEEALPVNLPTDLCVTPPPPEPHSSAPRLATRRSPSGTVTNISGQIDFKRFPSEEGNAPTISAEGPNGGQPDVIFRVPSLPVPSLADSLPNFDSSNETPVDMDARKKRKAPSRPISPKSSHLGDLPRQVVKSASLDEDRGDPFRKPLQSKSSNRGAAGSSGSLAIGDDSFVAMSDIRAAILNANCEEDMAATIGHRLTRPSLAVIKMQGIVRDRVNMFRQLGNSLSVPMESISGRSSGLSSRSSLGAGSVGEDEFVKPSAPPVTHSLNMGSSRRSSAATAGHVQLN